MKQIIQNLIAAITGFLTNLTTTDKSNLVNAINELNTSLIIVTKAQADTLIAASELKPGRNYKITGVDVGLYGGTDIILKAASTNLFETKGSGFFYNPKYTTDPGWGIWTKYMESDTPFASVVGTFDYLSREGVTAQNGATGILLADGFIEWVSGDWSAATSITGDTSAATATVTGFTSPSYSISDNVIWGGKHWINVNGNVGLSTDDFTLDAEWTLMVFNETDYNLVNDVIEYDYEIDSIYLRKDNIANSIQMASAFAKGFSMVSKFQWGNFGDGENGCLGNSFSNCFCNIINSLGSFTNNIVPLSSSIQDNIIGKKGVINSNEGFFSLSNNVINNIVRDNHFGLTVENCVLPSSGSGGIIGNDFKGNVGSLISIVIPISKSVKETTLTTSISGILYSFTLSSKIFSSYPMKTVYQKEDTTGALSYYDNTDTLQIVDVDA